MKQVDQKEDADRPEEQAHRSEGGGTQARGLKQAVRGKRRAHQTGKFS